MEGKGGAEKRVDKEVDRDARSRLKGQDRMERCMGSWLEMLSREGEGICDFGG